MSSQVKDKYWFFSFASLFGFCEAYVKSLYIIFSFANTWFVLCSIALHVERIWNALSPASYDNNGRIPTFSKLCFERQVFAVRMSMVELNSIAVCCFQTLAMRRLKWKMTMENGLCETNKPQICQNNSHSKEQILFCRSETNAKSFECQNETFKWHSMNRSDILPR